MLEFGTAKSTSLKLSSGYVRLQPHQAGKGGIQEEGGCQQEGAEALQQEGGRPGEALCPGHLPYLDVVIIFVVKPICGLVPLSTNLCP